MCHFGAVVKELLARADKLGLTPGDPISCFFVPFFFSIWSLFLILFLLLAFFNSWGRASVPRVIAGTRICKLVTRSLVIDGHRVEVNPNSRVRRSIVSEEAHAPQSSV